MTKTPSGPTASAKASSESKVGSSTESKQPLAWLGIRGFNPKLKKASERLGGLRTPEGEPIAPNTLAELRRDMVRRRLVNDQIRQIEDARLERLKQAPSDGPHAMVRLLARVIGVGIETADMLVQEVLSRNMRDRRAVARYAGLTGSPDESGRKRREKGLARSGNARVRRGMIQLAWRFLIFQKDSALAQWFRARTENARGTRKTMIVALARKLLIAATRERIDHVIVFGERHLRHLLRSYLGYYNEAHTSILGQGCADLARDRGRWSHIQPSRSGWIAPPICADLICDAQVETCEGVELAYPLTSAPLRGSSRRGRGRRCPSRSRSRRHGCGGGGSGGRQLGAMTEPRIKRIALAGFLRNAQPVPRSLSRLWRFLKWRPER